MVKAKATLADGRTLLVLGISEANVERLKAGDPIYFDAAQLRIAPGEPLGHVTVFYGKDEAELARTIRTLIGPATEVINIPRGDERPT
jgi:hypothetical protein